MSLNKVATFSKTVHGKILPCKAYIIREGGDNFVMVEYANGLTEFPSQWPNGTIAYNAFYVPAYLRELTQKAYELKNQWEEENRHAWSKKQTANEMGWQY